MRIVVAQYEGVTTMRPLPLAAGLLVATARAHFASDESTTRDAASFDGSASRDAASFDGSASRDAASFDLHIEVKRRPVDAAAERLRGARVVGLSLYTWNERYALAVARRLRTLSPSTLIVCGGPSVPRNDSMLKDFLATHAVDLAVLGEGELAFREILTRVAAGVDPLVPGAARLSDHTVVYGGPRDRLRDDAFSATASPYLDGTFDQLIDDGELDPPIACVFETNRGCPFSCSFCDWGQATESKVHELPLDRVLAELEWAARRRVPYVYFVDANFGIRRRDEDITRHLGQLKRTHGAPSFCYFHLTKNARKRNLRTVELLQDAGIGSQVSLSMQDVDLDVLTAIRRANIDPDDALSLRQHCHERGLPTTNELLLGLPRQTLASVRKTVVAALTPFSTDSFFLYPVRLLPNAPLAAEVELHGLVTRLVPLQPRHLDEPHPEPELERLVVGSPTLPIPDWRRAFVFGHALATLHDQALAPHTLRYAIWQAHLDTADLVDRLLSAFPPLAAVLERYCDAILDEVGTTLPLAGFGPMRWEPIEAATATILSHKTSFFDALHEVIHPLGPLAHEACAVDTALLASDADTARRLAVTVDWLGFTDGRIAPRPFRGTLQLGAVAAMGPAHLAWFLATGWGRSPRRQVSLVHDPEHEFQGLETSGLPQGGI